ncbi:MAG: undecaprenyldiphospho-muramoylpentapeptide beta-N-acetylglucosaminyltransferase [Clostridia bacterium]|nr:undecaprenyldiphospho-muramoylpentapeptide beta-N-acetylglucosaminyltransferase [Clostridia bacterium]
MKIIVTGGGSGGHMYPALAIAEKFKEKDAEVYYVGTDEIESVLWPKDRFPYMFIHARSNEFGGFKDLVKTIWWNVMGIFDSLKIIHKTKPDAIIGTGGYVGVPLMVAGWLSGVPCFIQEQNVMAGRANLLNSKFSKKVFLGFDEARNDFKNDKKMVFTGNPVRADILTKEKSKSRDLLGLDQTETIILMTGGSHGAPKINEVGLALAKAISGKDGVRLILSTGRRYEEKVKSEFKDAGVPFGKETNVEVYGYIENMADYLASSDLIVERSGAVSVAETLAVGAPSILIPSTYVYKNHQYYNAKVPADFGAAILMEEKGLMAETVVEKIVELLDDSDKLALMKEKARELFKSDTLDVIYECVESEIDGNR